MVKRVIVICIDGCGPEYLQSSKVPFIEELGKKGCFLTGNSIIPSVTNVNVVSILTGEYPNVHGITTNYYFERETGRTVYMETSHFIKTSTLLEQGMKIGLKTGLLTSKDKLRTLLNRGAHISFSAENPLPRIKKRLGLPPPIYSVDVNIWLIQALRETILKEDLTLAFAVTTDYAMHKYSPKAEESKRHMEGIDRELRKTIEILEKQGDEVLVCITADHGMSKKDRAINLEAMLKTHQVSAHMNPIIADRYVVHHRNLGGAAYIYLQNVDDRSKCLQILENTEGVELVLSGNQASKIFNLDKMRIGDFLVLGKKNYVFGLVEQEIVDVSLRSHGSLYERKVPIIMNLPRFKIHGVLCENKDLAFHILSWYTPS